MTSKWDVLFIIWTSKNKYALFFLAEYLFFHVNLLQ